MGRSTNFLSVPPSICTGAFGGHTGEGLLCCRFQTLELPPTGGQASPIFAVLPQADEDLYLQTGLPLIIGY